MKLPGTNDRRADESQDPDDQSWMTSWAAIGDSYSAGIGCGYRFDDDSSCARYNLSWPNVINNDERMGNGSRDFQFLACSGAKSPDILKKQVPQINDGVQVITLTAGGNDVGFADVLKSCIYAWNLATSCDDALTTASSLIQSEDFNNSINSLISAMIPKLGDNGRIYYVGYAPFFDAESVQCNDVSWAFWWTASLADRTLSTSIRQSMNVMVSQLNGIISELVKGAGDAVVFVDYSGWVPELAGRFCENGIIEPYGNNRELFFYEWGTIDDWEWRNESKIELRDTANVGNGTFAGQIQAWISEAQANDSSLVVTDIYANDTSQTNDTMSNSDDLSGRDAVRFDGIFRVFHPTQIGHSFIANLVFYYMGAERAKMLGQSVMPMVMPVSSNYCSASDFSEPENSTSIKPASVDCIGTSSVENLFWFDTDTAQSVRDNFCDIVASKSTTNIADATDQSSGMGESYTYLTETPTYTWLNVWVQNAGCDRATLYPTEANCRAMMDAIVDNCEPDSTKKYGGMATVDCEAYHMEIDYSYIRYIKTINATSTNSNGTTTNSSSTEAKFHVADITLTQSSTATATVI